MIHRPTEYQVYKKLMFVRKDIDPNFDGNEANKIISDSVEAAYLDLSFDELVHVDKACERLNNYAREKGKSIAKRAALELLAAIGDYLNGLEGKADDKTGYE